MEHFVSRIMGVACEEEFYNCRGVVVIVGGRMRVLFLSIEANSRSIFPLNQTTSLIYSHFVQTIGTLRRHSYLIDQLQYILRNSRYNSGIGGQSKNSYFAQDNSGIVLILTLRRTNTCVLHA